MLYQLSYRLTPLSFLSKLPQAEEEKAEGGFAFAESGEAG